MESNEIADLLQSQIIQLRDKSLQLKSKIDNSKTDYKRKYYKTKLKLNNEYLVKVLLTHSKLQLTNEINEKNISE